MKIEYRRNLMTSYMVLEKIEEPELWEQKMITHCEMPDIIFAEPMREDGQPLLWYNISGKQALDTVLETTPVSHELLCRLLLGVYNKILDLETFLLSPGGLLLQPECIFLNHEGSQVFFCYYAGYEKTLPEAFCDLLEYILPKLEHSDEAAVALAYQLYEQAAKEGFSLKELQNLLHISYDKELSGETEERQENPLRNDNLKEEQKNSINIPLAKSLKSKIIQKITNIKEKVFYKQEVQPIYFEPEEEVKVKKGRPTVLLSELSSKPEGILRYEGDGACTNFEIGQTPFVIGSGSSCDGQISSETVSRIHAKITKTEDIYFIEDLNSTNGTLVGGEALSYKTKMSLNKNDIVTFAGEKFRFI